MKRCLIVLLSTVVLLGLAAPSSVAAPREDRLASQLAQLWQAGAAIPLDDNPLAGNGDPCLYLSKKVLAPFASPGAAPTCTVAPGTRIFVIGFSSECSNVEPAPYFGANEAELRQCAIAADTGLDRPGITSVVTLDGKPVELTEVTTGAFTMDLPEGNIFGTDEDEAQSVAHGWVALLHPLTPGEHEIVISNTGSYLQGTEFQQEFDFTNTTTIIVEPGLRTAPR